MNWPLGNWKKIKSLITLALKIDNRIRERVKQHTFDITPAFRFPEHPKPNEPSMPS
jgi:hypothetical protein